MDDLLAKLFLGLWTHLESMDLWVHLVEAFIAIWNKTFKVIRCIALWALNDVVMGFMPLLLVSGLGTLSVFSTLVCFPVK